MFSEQLSEPNIPNIISKNGFNDEYIQIDDISELFSIRGSKHVQLESVLSFFQEHWDRLQDSFWIHIFHSLLFDSNLLFVELNDEKRCKMLFPNLQQFFKQSIDNVISLEDFATAANLFWIASRIQEYLDFITVLQKLI